MRARARGWADESGEARRLGNQRYPNAGFTPVGWRVQESFCRTAVLRVARGAGMPQWGYTLW